MPSNRLTKRRYAISNPKICKSPPTPPKAPKPPPPPWPPPYIRATLRCTGPSEQAERDLILYPDNLQNPTSYQGYSNDGYAFAFTSFQLGQAQSTLWPDTTWMYGNQTFWYAISGQPYTVPNIAFAFFNTNWQWQYPPDAEIRLILAYP